MVADAIRYEEDATFVYIFLRAIAREPYSRLGIDIGPGNTFSNTVEKEEDMMDKMDLMIERYATAAYLEVEPRRQWSTSAKSDLFLRFIAPKNIHLNSIHVSDDEMQDCEPTSQAYIVLSYPINGVHSIFSRGIVTSV